MDIVTGKDHPKDLQMYGIDIVNPDQPVSVAVWYDSVMPHINQAWDEGKQAIVVGGTGLYVKVITTGIASMEVPIDQSLRDELSELTIPQLQAKLTSLNQPKFASMNNSDQNNSRRLIRAIEICKDPFFVKRRTDLNAPESNVIGLKYSVESIQRNKIVERVHTRLEQGAIQETESLLKNITKTSIYVGYRYKSIISFIEKKLKMK